MTIPHRSTPFRVGLLLLFGTVLFASHAHADDPLTYCPIQPLGPPLGFEGEDLPVLMADPPLGPDSGRCITPVLPLPTDESDQIDAYLLLKPIGSSRVNFPIHIKEDLRSYGILAWSFTMRFSPNVLRPVAVLPHETLSQTWAIQGKYGDGLLWVAGCHSAPLEGSGTLVTLAFDVVGLPRDETSLKFPNFYLHTQENSMTVTPHSGVFSTRKDICVYLPLIHH
ncbi:MAG: hypothetical protein HC884_19555 [Chloroflexaceae bacterium]|nr:hypothetical protein [Chloroflexaceae bacterium]